MYKQQFGNNNMAKYENCLLFNELLNAIILHEITDICRAIKNIIGIKC